MSTSGSGSGSEPIPIPIQTNTTTTTTTTAQPTPAPAPVQKKKPSVIVLGAGVEGLTTALKIKERWGDGVDVEVVADVWAGDGDGDGDGDEDPKSPKSKRKRNLSAAGRAGWYTSRWAGAHYVSSSPPGTRDAEIAETTFREMWDLSAPASGLQAEECFLRLVQTELYAEGNVGEGWVNPFENMPEYHELTETELAKFGAVGVSAVSGYSFHTVTIDVPVYLRYLTDQVRENGVRLVRGHVQHIDQVLEGGSEIFRESSSASASELTGTSSSPGIGSPDAVVVCVGLGARSLGGVEDASVYPSRGQTVILRAPWVRFGRTFEDEVNKTWTYIIPRRGGNVVIGGVLGVGDWYPKARPETTRDILERGLKLCPELIPPETRTTGRGGVDDLIPLIVEEGCGLRPMREGGARIELEYMSALAVLGEAKRKVAVVHNYGHGTRGYIQSIGSAELVVGLLKEAFML